MIAAAVSAAVGVTVVVIFIDTSVGMSLLLSRASYLSRSLLSLSLAWFIILVREDSFSCVVVVVACSLADAPR